MQLPQLTVLLYAISLVTAAPQVQRDNNALSLSDSPLSSINALEKRKGGGGGRSGGSSSGGKGGSSGSGTGRGSSSDSTGGRTVSGSGSAPAYGSRYVGGANVPYSAGARSPTRSIAPYGLGIGAVAFFPGLWLYSVYAYPYPIGYRWNENGQNKTSNVTCLCQQYSVCGCDPDDNSTFLTQEMTNGSTTSGAPVNTSTVRTIDYGNGTIDSYINGTLDNGTTASGGTDTVSPATKLIINYGGYWFMVATVLFGVFLA